MGHREIQPAVDSLQPFDRLRTSRQPLFIIICQLLAAGCMLEQGHGALGIEDRAWGTELLISDL